MKRREFLATGIGTLAVAAAMQQHLRGDGALAAGLPALDDLPSPMTTTLNIKPVMTNIVHTGVWEGPCRWRGASVEEEKAGAQQSFARWSADLRNSELGQRADVRCLEPAQILFDESFVVPQAEWDKLTPDAAETDAFFLHPAGSSVSAFEIGDRFGKPILLKGLGCRNADIAAYTKSKGNEALVAADDREFSHLLSLLQARKVFRQTRVLFPTDRGLPAACSVGSIWDLDGLKERLGVEVKTVSYEQLSGEMERVLDDAAAKQDARRTAEQLVNNADRSFVDQKHVERSLLFYRAVRNLMARHGCNAFTIECFEFCSSQLPDRWQITPCLIHSLQRDLGHASSCEADLGSLLAMRMLMSVAARSCHQGNSDPRSADAFRINHSVPARKMNGFDQPDLPYQLGRFVAKGWGTKMVVDFMSQAEKTVTVARVDPSATKLLVLRGELVGASGWNQDLIGCSVEALIRPPAGRLDEFLRKRLEYGNHLQWVYGDWTESVRQLGEMLGLQVEVIA
ncbi:MAG: hypothetical protein KJ000_01795 [Pirellulaceae bacterium]|nr:hypothetical protein [Pirellulaceae bacterium]